MLACMGNPCSAELPHQRHFLSTRCAKGPAVFPAQLPADLLVLSTGRREGAAQCRAEELTSRKKARKLARVLPYFMERVMFTRVCPSCLKVITLDTRGRAATYYDPAKWSAEYTQGHRVGAGRVVAPLASVCIIEPETAARPRPSHGSYRTGTHHVAILAAFHNKRVRV